MLMALILLSYLCSFSVYGMEEKKVVVRDQSSMAVDQGHEVEKGKSPWDEPRAWTKLLNRQQKGLAVFASTQESKGTQAGDSLPKNCAICLKSLEEGKDFQTILPCSKQHILHNTCLVDWVRHAEKANCPICREPLTSLPLVAVQEQFEVVRADLKKKEQELEPFVAFHGLCQQLGLETAIPLFYINERLLRENMVANRQEFETAMANLKKREEELIEVDKKLKEEMEFVIKKDKELGLLLERLKERQEEFVRAERRQEKNFEVLQSEARRLGVTLGIEQGSVHFSSPDGFYSTW